MWFLNKIRVGKLLCKCGREKTPVKLHVGCGSNYKKGWINIDCNPRASVDLCINMRRNLPFPDACVDYIYNEHFIEHLSYEDGFHFLKESCRVLKPGGVLRTAFPDLDVLIDNYQKDSWRDMEWVKLIRAQWYPSGCFMLNECIREKGLHLYMYTVNELKRRLEEAGFAPAKMAECKVNQSSFADLANIEKRADSGIVEAVK